MNVTKPLQSDHYRQLLDQCIHCGLCLPACPTYDVIQTEMDSPRGRISLMRAAADQRIALDGAFQKHMELCLGCRACETACPSGVQYGALLEVARSAIEKHRRPSIFERLVRAVALRHGLPHRRRLRSLARVLRIYQVSGLSRLLRGLEVLPAPLRTMEALLPPLSTEFLDDSRPAPAYGDKRGTVAFFQGCVQDAFLARVNRASVRVLQRNGYEVHFPAAQTCCGAAALHVGEEDLARGLARRNVDAFARGDYVAVVNNAGGCGATLKEYTHLLADDPTYASAARRLSDQCLDISEFLAANLRVEPTGRLDLRVTYADSCHLRHAQGIVTQPRHLLSLIPGLTVVELARPDLCCGSAGTYNLSQPETAKKVLDAKMADIRAGAAQVVVTTNTGCHMQLLAGMRQSGYDGDVLHLVELLEQSYAG